MRGLDNAGAVNVVYSTKSGTGLTTLGNQYWFQGFTEQGLVFGVPEAGDQFGISLAAGDFNRDGISDLAIGVPGEDGGAGAVNVLYGSMNGLTNINSEFFQEGSSLSGFLQGTRELGDHFGQALTWGDFNHDGFGDLAIGAPQEDVVSATGANIFNAGEVHVLYGGRLGLSGGFGGGAFDEVFNLAMPGISYGLVDFDNFGQSLTAGDFNGDGFFDLAIGIPGRDLSGIPDVDSLVGADPEVSPGVLIDDSDRVVLKTVADAVIPERQPLAPRIAHARDQSAQADDCQADESDRLARSTAAHALLARRSISKSCNVWF